MTRAFLVGVLISISATCSADESRPRVLPKEFVVTLTRGQCEGLCAEYSVTLDAQGRVSWHGKRHVRRLGVATKVVDRAVVQFVVTAVDDAQVFLLPRTERICVDAPDFRIDVAAGGHSMSAVVQSCASHMNETANTIVRLGERLDRLIGTESWVRAPNRSHASPAPSMPGDARRR